jgi:DNA-binding MarR family transcriptional regulator
LPASRAHAALEEAFHVLTMVSAERIMVSMETNPGASLFVSGLETHLGYWLRQVSNAVSGSFARSLKSRQASVAEWVLLRSLFERKQSTPSELAHSLTMTRGAISKIVDRLQTKGWITCKTSSDDNRVQLLALTGAGRRAIPILAKIADENDHKFFSCLDAGERSELRNLLGKLAGYHGIRDVPVE